MQIADTMAAQRQVEATSAARAAMAPAAEETRWLTMEQVSERIQLPMRTVRMYVQQGKLRAYRPGTSRAVRVRAADVDRLFHLVIPKGVE
jgi:excisionase family DNA binding protein